MHDCCRRQHYPPRPPTLPQPQPATHTHKCSALLFRLHSIRSPHPVPPDPDGPQAASRCFRSAAHYQHEAPSRFTWGRPAFSVATRPTCRGMHVYVRACVCVCAPARQGPSTLTASDRYGRLEVGCAAVTRRVPGSRSAVSLSRGRRGHSCTRQALFHHMRRGASDGVTLAPRHSLPVSDVDSATFRRPDKITNVPAKKSCTRVQFHVFLQ